MGSERRRRHWNPFRSGRNAYSGLWHAFWTTRSLQLGVGATVVAFAIGVALRLTVAELVLIVLGGTVVLAAETLNTAIEMLCNFVHSGTDARIGQIKDVAAGATAWTEVGGVLGLAIMYAVQVWHLLGH